MVDVLIQTYNEEENLPHTLASLAGWVRRVFVVDSGSTDATRAIAERYGATVVQHEWEGYARQKNWALANLPFESPWTLILDADESVSPSLRDEIVDLTSRPPEDVREAGFLINRIFVFTGREIRHCGYFPSWNLRLFKRGMARYEDRRVHEHMICDGPVGRLSHLLIHEDRRGMEHFFAKHNRYSTLEARELYENPEPWPGLRGFLGSTLRRRRFIKSRILPVLPLGWLLRFVYMYILRLGVLDGRAGWRLSSLISAYEMQIQTKYQELRRLRGDAPGGVALARPEGAISRQEAIGTDVPHGGNGLANIQDAGELAEASQTRRHGQGNGNGHGNGERRVRGEAVLDPSPANASRAFDPPRPGGLVHGPATPRFARGGDGPRNPSNSRVVYPGARGRDDESDRKKPLGEGRVGGERVPVSVMIPTLNEAGNLARCLDHLTWADEVVIVDSGSRDKTQQIATDYGAKVVDFEWNGAWPKKKNWALRHVDFANDWVLIVDADEWITAELAREIGTVLREDRQGRSENVGYYVNRKFIFMGRWIKHCGYYPSWNLRLIKRGLGEYERLTEVGNTGSGDNEVHEHVVAQGKADYLEHDMLHFAFPNIHTFMEKHNRYSNWEAAVQFKKSGTTSAAVGEVLSRRRRLKNLSRNLPFRPTLRFLYSYIWKGGILDGQPGYVFCRLLAIYEYLSVAKYIELRRAADDEIQARGFSRTPSALPAALDQNLAPAQKNGNGTVN